MGAGGVFAEEHSIDLHAQALKAKIKTASSFLSFSIFVIPWRGNALALTRTREPDGVSAIIGVEFFEEISRPLHNKCPKNLG